MPTLILCRERLNRIHAILSHRPKGVSLRDFARTFGVHQREIEQARELGFVEYRIRQPRTGRPSLMVSRASRDVSEKAPAKLLPFRSDLPKPITKRMCLFAVRCTETESCERSEFGFKMTPRYKAWMSASPRAQSTAGARASASRVSRTRDTIAVMQWTYAQRNGEIPCSEVMPITATEIWLKLRDLGSWRATDGWKPPSHEIDAICSTMHTRSVPTLEELCGMV